MQLGSSQCLQEVGICMWAWVGPAFLLSLDVPSWVAAQACSQKSQATHFSSSINKTSVASPKPWPMRNETSSLLSAALLCFATFCRFRSSAIFSILSRKPFAVSMSMSKDSRLIESVSVFTVAVAVALRAVSPKTKPRQLQHLRQGFSRSRMLETFPGSPTWRSFVGV